jgi:hypothetical protein
MRRYLLGLFSIAPLALVVAAIPLDDLLPGLGGGDPGGGGGGGSGGGGGGSSAAESNGWPTVSSARFLDSGDGGAERIWGAIDCQVRTRVRTLVRAHVVGQGQTERNRFRRIKVKEGDYVSDGERCELGRNDHRTGPTVYRDGERLITTITYRLPKGFAIGRDKWQIVMQMKQSQPSDAGGGGPILALHASDGLWRVSRNTGTENEHIWTAPAQTKRWVRFAFDVTYSADPDVGSLRIHADLDGDGDVRSPHERSQRFELATLKRETAGDPDDGLLEGDAIPSHLRVGIYHDDEYRCRRKKCVINIDDVGVFQP